MYSPLILTSFLIFLIFCESFSTSCGISVNDSHLIKSLIGRHFLIDTCNYLEYVIVALYSLSFGSIRQTTNRQPHHEILDDIPFRSGSTLESIMLYKSSTPRHVPHERDKDSAPHANEQKIKLIYIISKHDIRILSSSSAYPPVSRPFLFLPFTNFDH